MRRGFTMISKHSKSRARRLWRCNPERVARQFHRKRADRETAVSDTKAAGEWLRISDIVLIVADAKGAEFDSKKRDEIGIEVCRRLASDSSGGILGTEECLMLLSIDYDETHLTPSELAQALKTAFDRVNFDEREKAITKFLTDHGWMKRAATARWLEGKGYRLPSQWMAPSGSADGSSEKEPIATRRTKKSSQLESWAREQINAENIPGKTKGFSWKEAERRAKATFPTLTGTSERSLKRLFGRLLDQPAN